jgi:hypothetical protein
MSWKVPFVVAFPTTEFDTTSAHGFDTFLEVFFWVDIALNFRSFDYLVILNIDLLTYVMVVMLIGLHLFIMVISKPIVNK